MTDNNHKPSLLISFGGNALNVPDQVHAQQKEEFVIAEKSMNGVVDLIERGYNKIILTHGNGPQVGQIFLQQELTKHAFPRQITLDVCVADSQGRIGYILQNVFDNVCQKRGLCRKSFAVITQVVVDRNDPDFDHPSKPIGVFCLIHLILHFFTFLSNCFKCFKNILSTGKSLLFRIFSIS